MCVCVCGGGGGVTYQKWDTWTTALPPATARGAVSQPVGLIGSQDSVGLMGAGSQDSVGLMVLGHRIRLSLNKLLEVVVVKWHCCTCMGTALGLPQGRILLFLFTSGCEGRPVGNKPPTHSISVH